MPKDFAKKSPRRAATRNKPESRVPGWVWLLTGAVLGAFIMFLVRLSEMPAGKSTRAPEPPTATKATNPAKKEQPRFDFYNLLKESEVPVPQAEEKQSATVAAEPQQFILQVASFKDARDAEQLRAELILLNLEAHVETAKVRNGETWHRVLVGPFESRSRLAKARSILASNRLEALVLKRSPQG
jgi:cell division protein FtsN